MTIFLEIAKQFLIAEVKKLHDVSVTNDAGLVNRWRNKELSAAKRHLLNTLERSLETARNGENDEANKVMLNQLLQSCLDSMDTERGKYHGLLGSNFQVGDTERGLMHLQTLLSGVYNKLTQLKVLETPHDTDPYHCFQYYIAGYCAQVIIDGHNDILVPHQDELVIDKLKACMVELGLLPTEMGEKAREELLLTKTFDQVKATQLANHDLHRQYNIPLAIPKDGFFAEKTVPYTEVQLGGGLLGKYLRACGQELKRNLRAIQADNEEIYKEEIRLSVTAPSAWP